MENNDLKNNVPRLAKEAKIKALLDYARECCKNGHKPSKKEIRRIFHVEIYNYFKDTPDYHRKAGIEVSLRNYEKENARKSIVDFVQKKAKGGDYPTRKEIEKALNIHLSTYFKNLEDLYICANVDYSLVQKKIKQDILQSHTYTEEEIERQKRFIKDFIQKSTSQGFYPSVQSIQKNLNLSFYNLYGDIFEAYKDAGVEYERPSPILLGKKKEEVFTKIVKELLLKMGFNIIRVSIESTTDFNRRADMTIEDTNGIKYLVEIKAYREDYHITRREFEQLAGYLRKENIPAGMIITTSNTKKCEFDNIKLINGKALVELLNMCGLSHHLELIRWIQNSRVNFQEREKNQEALKKEILYYIKSKAFLPKKKEITKEFGIDLRSIFGKVKPYEKLKKEVENLGTLIPRI